MFKQFKEDIQKQWEVMLEGATKLFTTDADKDKLWEIYLSSFPDGTNPIYRERTEHDCSCCRNFIKSLGGVIAIKNNEIVTIWDGNTVYPYSVVSKALSDYVKSCNVNGVYINNTDKHIGVNHNFEEVDGKINEYHHLYVQLSSICRSSNDKSYYDSSVQVLGRGLAEITKDALLTVLELIEQGSLYRGEEWKNIIKEYIKLQDKYNLAKNKNNFIWAMSSTLGQTLVRLRNTSIGTLLINISEDMDLDEAVRKYEAIVAPENYKRPKAIYTKRMIEDAEKKIVELGFANSLGRRHAHIDDISANNVLYINRDASKKVLKGIFEQMKEDAVVNPKKFSRVEEITIDDFINKVAPIATNIEVLLENKFNKNLVSLIAPDDKDAPSMFKWNNPFSWAYAGNLTDSAMKENVKKAGGKVDGVLRFSIQWNDGEVYNKRDFDAHCKTPTGEIYYWNKRGDKTGGELDVDIISPKKGVPAVENITWASMSTMYDGEYKFFVHNFSGSRSAEGFKAEIEFDGEIYSFEYNKPLDGNERVYVADVTLKNGQFTIKTHLDAVSGAISREVWGLKTNSFVPVSMIMYSPNYWDDNKVGNKHYFFMLKDCKNDEEPNGFYNEFMHSDLIPHRKVIEALGSKMYVKYDDNQLSGIGFSSTRNNDLIVRVTGKTERILKVRI